MSFTIIVEISCTSVVIVRFQDSGGNHVDPLHSVNQTPQNLQICFWTHLLLEFGASGGHRKSCSGDTDSCLWMYSGLNLLHVSVNREPPRQGGKCWVWWRSALFKNACGCSVYRTSLGLWGWSATSLYLTSWVISSSLRRFRTPLILSIMGVRKDGVSLNTDGRGACFHGEGGGISGFYSRAQRACLTWGILS